MKYHVNSKTGRAGQCRATKRGCPLGADTPHFDTKEEAQAHIEKTAKSENKTFSKLSKNSGGVKTSESERKELVKELDKARSGWKASSAKYLSDSSEENKNKFEEAKKRFDEANENWSDYIRRQNEARSNEASKKSNDSYAVTRTVELRNLNAELEKENRELDQLMNTSDEEEYRRYNDDYTTNLRQIERNNAEIKNLNAPSPMSEEEKLDSRRSELNETRDNLRKQAYDIDEKRYSSNTPDEFGKMNAEYMKIQEALKANNEEFRKISKSDNMTSYMDNNMGQVRFPNPKDLDQKVLREAEDEIKKRFNRAALKDRYIRISDVNAHAYGGEQIRQNEDGSYQLEHHVMRHVSVLEKDSDLSKILTIAAERNGYNDDEYDPQDAE